MDNWEKQFFFQSTFFDVDTSVIHLHIETLTNEKKKRTGVVNWFERWLIKYYNMPGDRD